MKIVFPMAGRGSRFLELANVIPEYAKPKPLINVLGKPMVAWAVESLPFVNLPNRPAKTKLKVQPEDIVFICRRDHEDDFQISEKLKKLFSEKIAVLFVEQITRGAAETVLIAKDPIDNEEELLISDSDHFFNGENLYKTIIGRSPETVGITTVFTPPDEEVKWSYTLFDENKVALAVGEKDPELAKKGAYANIGAYFFSKGKIFVSEAEQMIREGDMYGAAGKQEFYIAPIYNHLIKKGLKVEVAVIGEMWGLGTPKDVEYFVKNYKK